MKKVLAGLLLILAVGSAVLTTSGYAQFTVARIIERAMAGLSAHAITSQGLNIHYLEGGPSDAPTIILLHGFAADKDNWLRFSRYLTDDYHVMAIDLPGFGDSQAIIGSYDVGTQAERLANIIEDLQLPAVHLVGNSMGGHIAAIYAARYPEAVRSLALLNNAGITSPRPSEIYAGVARGQANPLIVSHHDDFDRLLDVVFVTAPYLPDQLKQHLASRAATRAPHYRQVFEQLVQRSLPLEPLLGDIHAPVWILWGAQDRVRDVSSIEVMAPLLRDVKVTILEGVGHVPMIERPRESALAYRAFLEQLPTH